MHRPASISWRTPRHPAADVAAIRDPQRNRLARVQAFVRRLAVVAVGFGLAAAMGGCTSSSDAANAPGATSTSTTSTTKVSGPCSENVILRRVFDEEMVSGCLQISGVTSETCDNGSIVGLIDISGTPLIVVAGSSPQRVDDDVAAPLDPPQPQRFEVDRRELLTFCP